MQVATAGHSRMDLDKLSIVLILSIAFIHAIAHPWDRTPDVQILTPSHSLRLNVGESVQLGCEFQVDHFNLFDNPVLWRKTQRYEQTQINMMGNLLEPFVTARRFRVAFASQDGMHTLWLSITDLSPEDNGNYTCEIHGPNNIMMGNVTHHIIVGDPIDIILLTNKNITPPIDVWPLPRMSSSGLTSIHADQELFTPTEDEEAEPDDEDSSRVTSSPMIMTPGDETRSRRHRGLVYTESVPATLRCIAIGNAPSPPTLRLHIGRRDITADFRSSARSLIVSGLVGMRLIRYVVELWRHDFRADVADRNKRITCTASSTFGTMSNSTSVRLLLNHAPIIDCESNEAYLNEANIFIRCEILSHPPPSDIYWIIDDNDTVLTDGESIGEYNMLLLLHMNGVHESQLYIKRVSSNSFRHYDLVARNSVATRRQTVALIQKYRSTSSQLQQLQQQQFMNTRSAAPLADSVGNYNGIRATVRLMSPSSAQSAATLSASCVFINCLHFAAMMHISQTSILKLLS